MDSKGTHLNALSIVLVCMDNLEAVIKTHRSLQGLNYPTAEIIVIDSSRDQRIESYISEYLEHENIKYFWQSPQGVYAAMNLGIKKWKNNSYVWFLNPGDVLISPLTVFKIMEELAKKDLEWGFAQARNAYPNQANIYPSKEVEVSQKKISRGELTISHQAIFAKKSALVKNGYFDQKLKIASDIEMTMKLAKSQTIMISEVAVEIDQNGISSLYPLKTIFETALVNRRLGLWGTGYTYFRVLNNLAVLFYGQTKFFFAKRVKKVMKR